MGVSGQDGGRGWADICLRVGRYHPETQASSQAAAAAAAAAAGIRVCVVHVIIVIVITPLWYACASQRGAFLGGRGEEGELGRLEGAIVLE